MTSCASVRVVEPLTAPAETKLVATRATGQTERGRKRGGELWRRQRAGAGAGGDDAARAQEECVGETRQNFFDVVGDEDERGGVFLARESIEKTQKFFARDGIEAGARFVENHQARAGHERAGDEHPLAFTLREKLPLAVDQAGGAERTEKFFRCDDIGAGGGEPEIELRIAAADDRFDGGFGRGHAGLEGAGDDADLEPELAPVSFAVALAEEGDIA